MPGPGELTNRPAEAETGTADTQQSAKLAAELAAMSAEAPQLPPQPPQPDARVDQDTANAAYYSQHMNDAKINLADAERSRAASPNSPMNDWHDQHRDLQLTEGMENGIRAVKAEQAHQAKRGTLGRLVDRLRGNQE